MDNKEQANEEINENEESQNVQDEEGTNKHIILNEGEEDKVDLDMGGKDNQKDLSEMLEYLKGNKTWDDLKIPNDLKENLISKGFKKPSKIQCSVITLHLKNIDRDLIAQSQNGSGKTLAFLIPALISVDKTIKATKAGVLAPQVIILADTRELTYQTSKILNLIKPDGVIAEFHYHDKKEGTHPDTHIIVCTMGSLGTMINKRKMVLNNLKLFIIDEADKMIESDSNRAKLPTIYKNLPKEAKVCLFSATFPEKSFEFLNKSHRTFTKITIQNKVDLSLTNLNHFYVRCNRKTKLEFMDSFLGKFLEGSVIIFVNSKRFADTFTQMLHKKGHKAEILLSDMSNEDRLEILDEFKTGKIRVLVSTNLISRGIDARKVSLVVNLDLPYIFKAGNNVKGDRRERIDCETYLHRGGRTARFGDQGTVLSLVEDDRNFNDLGVIENEYGIKMQEITTENFQDIINKNNEAVEFNKDKRKFMEEDI